MAEAGPKGIEITPLSRVEEDAVLRLNNAHAIETSFLDAARLRHVLSQAFFGAAVGKLDAFLIAFDQDADYDSPNFLWLRNARRQHRGAAIEPA